jgi:hypothetical protein
MDSRLHNNDQELLTNYRRLSQRDQKLLRHRVLLQTAEEAVAVKAHELEEF